MRDADYFTELFWFTSVVELGSFSAAAEHMGVAKSSLGKRVRHLEERLGVQLLNRNNRKLVLTTIGEEIYRHALDMLTAAHAAQICASDTLERPGGLIRVAIPTILSEWLLKVLSQFKNENPDVRYEVHIADNLANTALRHLDLCLSVHPSPTDSAELVVRPIATLQQQLLASPQFIQNLDNVTHMTDLRNDQLLAWGANGNPYPWVVKKTTRIIKNPAIIAPDLYMLKEAAKAGIGVACLPLLACRQELESQALQPVCENAQPEPLQLNSLTPSFRGITLTTRCLIDAIRKASAETEDQEEV